MVFIVSGRDSQELGYGGCDNVVVLEPGDETRQRCFGCVWYILETRAGDNSPAFTTSKYRNMNNISHRIQSHLAVPVRVGFSEGKSNLKFQLS